MKILITGAAGFIGYHLAKACLAAGWDVTGIDSVNNYYNPRLKRDRLKLLGDDDHFQFYLGSMCDKPFVDKVFEEHRFDVVVNLAAQSGVRYSIEKPYEYIDANLIGFINVLEACRHFPVKHLLFASSSSVYGNSEQSPFVEHQCTEEPVSLYAATKKANELMAFSYANLYGIRSTGLRFFTVYGPWGRPDMAYFHFTKSILEGTPIKLFNNGEMWRDFTYVDDVVTSIMALTTAENDEDEPLFQIYNIGNHQPVRMRDFIEILEDTCGQKAIVDDMPFQSGDVKTTFADVAKLEAKIGFVPQTRLRDGLAQFVQWYRNYYNC
jgi:UDP-glucuronate 4-epimerase